MQSHLHKWPTARESLDFYRIQRIRAALVNRIGTISLLSGKNLLVLVKWERNVTFPCA